MGISDKMSIIWVQISGSEIRIVKHYTNSGEGFEHYAEKIRENEYEEDTNPLGFRYSAHWFPHDIRARELNT